MAVIYNVVRGDGVFFEGMTKEQIYELIAEMTGETVQDIDQAFITKLKEINKGNSIRLWLGTSAEYNALETKEDDVLYICTDDTFVSDTNTEIQEIWNKIDSNYNSIMVLMNQLIASMNEFEQNIKIDINKIPEFGQYSGYYEGGAPNYDWRTINLGFTPSKVYVFGHISNDAIDILNNSLQQIKIRVATDTDEESDSDALRICTNGFMVRNVPNSNTLNSYGLKYDYIAVR